MGKEIILGIIDPEGYEHANRVYSTMGIVPTLSARDWKDPIKILDKVKAKNIMAESRAEQSRAEQSRAEQSRAEQSRAESLHSYWKNGQYC